MRLLLVLVLALFPVTSPDVGAVHEWGTFTSVAGRDGGAMQWRPLYGPSDLPCFVHHLDQRNLKAADYGTIRMETPVLYFYPLKPQTVSVHVDFPDGRITEWYPQASGVQPSSSRNGWIEWNQVALSNDAPPLLTTAATSHYYAARATKAWPLQSEGEQEKLLFYRGIAHFDVDLRPVVQATGVCLRNAGADVIPTAILFENRGGKVGYQVVHGLRERLTLQLSALNGSLDGLRGQLEAELTEMGLFRDEAHAMLETWGDSWFEEGLRVFYILPRPKVDALLPISIKPAPSQLARVFVGRVELLSPAMRKDIETAAEQGNTAVLKKYGRFLDAFLVQMGDANRNGHVRQLLTASGQANCGSIANSGIMQPVRILSTGC